MPLYDYECANGHRTEREFTIVGRPQSIECPECGTDARKIITGTVMWTPHPTWLDSSLETLVSKRSPDYRRLKENWSREERTRYMEEKGIVCIGDGSAGADRVSDEVPQLYSPPDPPKVDLTDAVAKFKAYEHKKFVKEEHVP